jgi:hypothetical protein
MIAVGRCPNSTGIQFYNPSNGTLVSSIDNKFQPNLTSGAHFVPQSLPWILLCMYIHILHLSYHSPNVYTVSFRDGNISEYTDDLLSASPTLSTSPNYLCYPTG